MDNQNNVPPAPEETSKEDILIEETSMEEGLVKETSLEETIIEKPPMEETLIEETSMIEVAEPESPSIGPEPAPQVGKTYTRFELSQRIEHVIFLVSFSILGATGLAQKFSSSPLSSAFLRALGGIEMTRLIHHVAAITMGVVSAYHIVIVLYRVIVLRSPLTMLPWIDDFKHLFQDVQYYIGLRKHRAYYGRYTYAEKVEYLAVVWGTLVMGLTGFMMWNPIATARLLPGQAIPAAKAAHGGEAVLAVLAIIIWHFYHVHLRHFNKSMFTGKLTQHEMEQEHPAELAQIEAGLADRRPPTEVIRKRQKVFMPLAAVLAVGLSLGLYAFVSIETTAVTTVPKGETAAIFAPLTPTSRPTLAPTPTLVPIAGVAANSWKGTYEALFRNRCSTCHGVTSVGGLSLASYQGALKGGKSGAAIVPGNPDASMLVQVQSTGKHPGQLTLDELNQVIQWILTGALEQ